MINGHEVVHKRELTSDLGDTFCLGSVGESSSFDLGWPGTVCDTNTGLGSVRLQKWCTDEFHFFIYTQEEREKGGL